MQTHTAFLRRSVCLVFALILSASLAFSLHAQEAKKPLPITTGTATSSMDAGETNSELEQYTHSATVQSLARHLGIPVNRASRYFEDLNSGVLIAVVLYYMLKILPGKFRARRQGIDRELVEARNATQDAERRLRGIEDRLASLNGEVDALRKQAMEASRDEETRIHASFEEERKRIVRSAGAEIQAAQTAAERGLKRFTSDLAVERAAERVRLTPEGDRLLIDDFLQSLANDPGLRGRN